MLQLIRSGRANTRADLQRATGLSRSTVGQRLDLLNRAGWLRHTTGTSTGGRPSDRIEFDPGHASVVAVDLETRHARVAVLDLAGTVLAERTGDLDIAQDIGHIRLHDHPDALCMCGSYGCLAAVASGGALARALSEQGLPTASGSDVRRLLAEGNPEVIRLAQQAGHLVGAVLATVVTLLNPGVLMIAGDLAGVPFTTGVRELLYQRAMPRTTANLSIVSSQLGDRAGLMGAAAMVVRLLYSPEHADDRLRRLSP
ncbi:ROK family transcriptional regulator [Streptomyces flaveolus]|uniref:ROK family transcriptional regulator n=1 Tax=Streptomyces flaveolus TaxID=67297 RepID=UPI001E648AD0|nr:ROK family protein [Streptomyces flaveolus]